MKSHTKYTRIFLNPCLHSTAFLYERRHLKIIIEENFTRADGSSDAYVTEDALVDDWCAYIMTNDAPFEREISRCMLALHTVSVAEQPHADTDTFIYKFTMHTHDNRISSESNAITLGVCDV